MRDLGETTRLPVRDLHQAVVELARRVDRVPHLRLTAPALRRTLLEEAEGVPVAVVEVAQPRLLLGGGERDHDGPLRQSALLGDAGDGPRVRQLFLGQGQVGPDEGAPAGDPGDAAALGVPGQADQDGGCDQQGGPPALQRRGPTTSLPLPGRAPPVRRPRGPAPPDGRAAPAPRGGSPPGPRGVDGGARGGHHRRL
ncbi:hypothetical protein E4P40_05445 [Blastococcus sp. CT_GayMR20]|nr:hypothetical protein E4P40_05445 [Blastococcus sp. CT_GayMR20]